MNRKRPLLRLVPLLIWMINHDKIRSGVNVDAFFLTPTRLKRQSSHPCTILHTAPPASSTSPAITIHIVENPEDVRALSDLRYDEWIRQENMDNNSNDGNNDDTNPSAPANNIPSRAAFGWATAELVQERRHVATSFLAKRTITTTNKDDDDDPRAANSIAVVGAAELSQEEFGITTTSSSNSNNQNYKNLFYVTDVVTSSHCRRQGIGAALMDALEYWAYQEYRCQPNLQQTQQQQEEEQACIGLLLHVKPDNEGAIAFYQKRGYQELVLESEDASLLFISSSINKDKGTGNTLDSDKAPALFWNEMVQTLEANASIAPNTQLLLCKILTAPPARPAGLLADPASQLRTRQEDERHTLKINNKKTNDNTNNKKRGFGMGGAGGSTKSKATKKRRSKR